MQIFTEELDSGLDREKVKKIDFFRPPFHIASVERSVEIVTEALGTLCSKSARDGFIKAKIKFHKLMPKFDIKNNFCVK